MSFDTQTCITLTCDGCGDHFDYDYEPHFPAKADATEYVQDMGGEVTEDDQLYCEACTEKRRAHRDLVERGVVEA